MTAIQKNSTVSLQNSDPIKQALSIISPIEQGALSLLNGFEKRVVLSDKTTKIKDCTDAQILSVLGYCLNLLNTKSVPEKDAKLVIMDFLRVKIPETPLQNIKEAFMMAVAREIVSEAANIDNVYSFSPA